MLYISGIYALNLNCELDTCGDWHQSGLNWDNITFKESEGSFYGIYGLEYNKRIPNHQELFTTANHIRACLDMLIDRKFDTLQGMNKDFICNEKYDQEIFFQVLKLNVLPQWEEIKLFMDKEYGKKWINYRKEHING